MGRPSTRITHTHPLKRSWLQYRKRYGQAFNPFSRYYSMSLRCYNTASGMGRPSTLDGWSSILALIIVTIPQAVWAGLQPEEMSAARKLWELQYRKRYGQAFNSETQYVNLEVTKVTIPQAVWAGLQQ